MKIQNKKRHSKLRIIILVTTIVVASLFGLFYLYKNNKIPFLEQSSHDTNNSSIDYGPASQDQIKSGNAIKQDSSNTEDKNNVQNSSTDNNATKNITISILSTTQNNANLHIATSIDRITSDGSCIMTMTQPGSNTVSQTVKVQPMASYSTCQGFDIAISGFSGQWNINIIYKNGDLTGNISKSITVN